MEDTIASIESVDGLTVPGHETFKSWGEATVSAGDVIVSGGEAIVPGDEPTEPGDEPIVLGGDAIESGGKPIELTKKAFSLPNPPGEDIFATKSIQLQANQPVY